MIPKTPRSQKKVHLFIFLEPAENPTNSCNFIFHPCTVTCDKHCIAPFYEKHQTVKKLWPNPKKEKVMFQGPPCVSLCRLPPRYDQSNVTTSKMHQRCYPSWVRYMYLHERLTFMVNVGKLIYHTWILRVAYLAPEN